MGRSGRRQPDIEAVSYKELPCNKALDHGYVDQTSEQRKRSAHWIMREAILRCVDREKARESFKQEAEVSWSEFQATGMHLTGEETRTDAETEAPPCHD